MGTNRVYPFSGLPGAKTPVEVTSRLLEYLARLVHRDNPDLDPRSGRTVITVPASFSALARNDTLDAAVGAGFSRDRVMLLDEPVAALLDTVNHQDAGMFLSESFQNVLMFDYGGGTCDLALMGVRLRSDSAFGLHIETLAISPYRKLGGDDVDRAIMEEIVWPAICTADEKRHLDTGTIESITDCLLVSVARRLKEQICNDLRRHIHERGAWPEQRMLRKLRADVKLGLQFGIHSVNLQRQYTMTAEELQEVMRPFLSIPKDVSDESDSPKSLIRPIVETLSRADVEPGDLDVVVLNGVSSLNPFVRQMLEAQLGEPESLFPNVRFMEVPSLTCSVARGAALACYWQHARGTALVAPIMPEPLGVIVQHGPPEQIVEAGTVLPFPGPDAVHSVRGRFFVPAKCGPEMLVPYYTGYAGSPQSPRHAGTVKVEIPTGTRPGSDVTVKLRISGDKTMEWWFSIGNGPPAQADSVEDPWTQRAPTFAERALIEHRRSLRTMVDSGRPLDVASLLEEANLMRRAGDAESAIVTINDLIEHFGPSASLHNVRGLAYDDLGRRDEALADYKAGADLKPDDAILRGNYGVTLLEAERFEEADATIRQALKLNPNLAYLHQSLAQLARRNGSEQEARRELEEAEKLHLAAAERQPLNPEMWGRLAFVRSMLNDNVGAMEAARRRDEAEQMARLGGKSTDVVSGIKQSVGDQPRMHDRPRVQPPNLPDAVTTLGPSRRGRGLDKVAGMHTLKEQLRREVIGPVRDPEPYRQYGLSIPNGMLLYGPPGCGKTYIARQLAEELGYYFVEVIPSEVGGIHVHEGVMKIRGVFDRAMKQAPAIVFIDEFEALVPLRSHLGGHQQYKAEEVNEFLAHLNDCADKNIFVIAATNWPGNIDPAVQRTGRLDKRIYVGPPDVEARAEMLALHLEGRPVASELDIRAVAVELQGYSASDIRFLVDEAARAAFTHRRHIASDSFRAAMAKVPPSVTPEQEAQYQSVDERG
jgi:AAA+ superfamily predicted ATPase